MNAAAPGNRLPPSQFERASNVMIVGECPTTRYGLVFHNLAGDVAGLNTLNIQGALFFNPAEGQGALSFSQDQPMIVASVGGRKFAIRFEGEGVESKLTAEEITNGFLSDPQAHLVYWSQWENYALAQDGNGNCFIWDGAAPAFTSKGYDKTVRPSSEVPNAATVMAYAHGRGVAIVNERAALVSDLLNSRDLEGPGDVLKFTEQTYFATGQYFSPPSRMGTINAAATLSLKDTNHGHGSLMLHCERGIFSIDLNVYPRTAWSQTPMVREAYKGTAALGPYALAVFDGDQVFRSSVGVQGLRSARAESSLLGNPFQPLSDNVGVFFKPDVKPWLRFAVVTPWTRERRCFFTCQPIVHQRYRWHRGIVSINFDPVPGVQTPAGWESVWTLPGVGVVQTLSGDIDKDDRFFALCRDYVGKNHVCEFRPELRGYDILPDGTRQRIRCQLITRRVDANRPFTKKEFQAGSLYLKNIVGKVTVAVWVRAYGEYKWKLWKAGEVENKAANCWPGGEELEGEMTLGDLPDISKTTRFIQFLIRWAGHCSLESLRLAYASNGADEDAFEPKSLEVMVCDVRVVDYSDFEYSETPEPESWLTPATP